MRVVADNFQIINPHVETAIKNRAPGPIQNLIKNYEHAGADAIDLNTGPLSRNPVEIMSFLVEAIQKETNLPILLDTANPLAMDAGLAANKKTVIINGFSLEPHKLDRILPLVKQFDVDIIGYLLYPNGHIPPNASERLAIALELYQKVKSLDIDPGKLIIDPVIVPLTWADGSFQAKEILSVIQNLPNLLDFPVKTIVGLSNLTTGQPDRNKKIHMEQTYLPMLASAGLNMVLLNIFHKQIVRSARTSDLILNPGIFSWEEV